MNRIVNVMLFVGSGFRGLPSENIFLSGSLLRSPLDLDAEGFLEKTFSSLGLSYALRWIWIQRAS